MALFTYKITLRGICWLLICVLSTVTPFFLYLCFSDFSANFLKIFSTWKVLFSWNLLITWLHCNLYRWESIRSYFHCQMFGRSFSTKTVMMAFLMTFNFPHKKYLMKEQYLLQWNIFLSWSHRTLTILALLPAKLPPNP